MNNLKNIDEFLKFKPNFIFVNGAIHHLNDETVKSINSFIVKNFSDSYFLSIDPVRNNNNFLNNVMIKLDRGQFIRNKVQYEELMNSYESFVVNDFYKMDFENIFHYKKFNLKEFYYNWKKEIS